MINMNMPDFVDGRALYDIFMHIVQDHPEVMYEDTKIASIFGCFPSCIWNGGGMNIGTQWTRKEMQKCINYYNDVLNIPLRFTFTNPVLTEKHLNDTYANVIAEVGHNGKNEILTSSRILENYLRDKYPNYKYCSSIVGTDVNCYGDPERYDLVVMRRRMNNNWEYLNSIPMSHRSKIEFLCNDPCPDNCPRIYSHYRDFGRAALQYDDTDPRTECSMLEVKGELVDYYTTTLETYISREMILKDYIPQGFTQFKVSGRTNITAMTNNILQYLTKPEYRPDVLAMILEPYLHYLPTP